MEPSEHIAAIAAEGKLLAVNAEQAGLDAAVPSCPGWDVRDLLRHLSEIHLWAAAQVTKRADKLWPDGLDDIAGWWPDLADFWPEDDKLVAYYLTTNANLVAALEAAPDDLECNTFLDAPSSKAMWARRQAHETAIHRYDAEQANAAATEFASGFASDGIDELLVAFGSRWATYPVETTRTMRVETTDSADRWHLTFAPDGITPVNGSADDAEAVLRGRASDLYVSLWNRENDDRLTIEGDGRLVEIWHTKSDIRWS